jgi:hypothetical protein
MILDEIKNLIKELENILIKDKRFKDSYNFKNQVKIIYKHKNNLNNLNNLNNNLNISQLPNIDITPFISNLITLNKPPEINKSLKCNECNECNELPNKYNNILKKLIDKINELYEKIDPSSLNLDVKKISDDDIKILLNSDIDDSKVQEILKKITI